MEATSGGGDVERRPRTAYQRPLIKSLLNRVTALPLSRETRRRVISNNAEELRASRRHRYSLGIIREKIVLYISSSKASFEKFLW